jgi:hypothetical protein
MLLSMAAAQVNQMAARRAGNPCLCQMPIKRQSPTQDRRLGVGLSSYWWRATMHAIHRDTSAAARWPISEATTYRALSSHRHGTRSTSHATNTECQGVVVTGACCAMHEAAAGSRIHWSQKQNGLHQNYQVCNPCALPPPRGEPHRRLDLVPRCRPRRPQLSSSRHRPPSTELLRHRILRKPLPPHRLTPTCQTVTCRFA